MDEKITETPLDMKDVSRIRKMDTQRLMQLEARYIGVLTHDFDERYSRLVVAKGNTPEEKRQLLDALIRAFAAIHDKSGWNEDTYYDRDFPEYFDKWDMELVFDGDISEEGEGCPPAEIVPTPAPTLTEMLNEEGMLRKWLGTSTDRFEALLQEAKEHSEKIFSQIETVRDGSLTRMQDALAQLEVRYDSLHYELAQTEVENERLRKKLKDLENTRRCAIGMDDIKKGLLRLAKCHMGSEDALNTFVGNFDRVLKGTGWDNMSDSILGEMKEAFVAANLKEGQTYNINIGHDFVMEKNVKHEVANVESGGIGIKAGKK